jgi:hypothetical protein
MPYSGAGALTLALVLALIAAALAYAGTRVRAPLAVQRPGRIVAAFMIVIWVLAVETFLIALRVYALQLRETGFLLSKSRPVQVGTYFYALVTFCVVAWLTRRFGWRVALCSGFVAACAAPMLFELPFDLIVASRTVPPVPPRPELFRALFFFPLFIVEFATVSLLALVPPMRITRGALYALAAMFAVFAVWATFGFAYPSVPVDWTLNVISKILCFVAAILLFVWKVPASTDPPNDLPLNAR